MSKFYTKLNQTIFFNLIVNLRANFLILLYLTKVISLKFFSTFKINIALLNLGCILRYACYIITFTLRYSLGLYKKMSYKFGVFKFHFASSFVSPSGIIFQDFFKWFSLLIK